MLSEIALLFSIPIAKKKHKKQNLTVFLKDMSVVLPRDTEFLLGNDKFLHFL